MSMSTMTAVLFWQWVAGWLEDVGLPQYQDAFLSARVDGRLLDAVTEDELQQLGVSSQLHRLSIHTGISVLRSSAFKPIFTRAGNGETGDLIFWSNSRSGSYL